jgi:hypothetical protein
MTALAKTSFTLVRSALDRVWKTSVRPAPRATSCIGVGPQSERANMCTFNGLHGSNTVGFVAHGGNGCCDAVCDMKELLLKESIATWLTITALLFALVGWVEAQTYVLTDLGAHVVPTGINERGDISTETILYRQGVAHVLFDSTADGRIEGVDENGIAYGSAVTNGESQAFTYYNRLSFLNGHHYRHTR